MSALVSPAQAADLIEAGAVVVDVQYVLGGPPSVELYAAAHLPGARHLALDEALAGPPGRRGRHPLPEPGVLETALRRCGVDDDSTVLVYDQRTSLAAARAWWVLRWAGLTDVHVLDGGLAAWVAQGRATTTDVPPPGLGTVVVRPGALPHHDADTAYAMARQGRLLDVRTPERYRGESEPIDRVAGRIPGAVNLPMGLAQDETGRFAPPEQIRALVAGLGLDDGSPVATTCGSGITAAQMVLALDRAGIEAAPYIGSWSEWIEDPTRPVERGAGRGGRP